MTHISRDERALESGCPFHRDIADCPLYIESHVGEGRGCVDDMALDCRVSRGQMNYQKAIIQLAAIGREYPGLLQSIHTVGGMQ